MRIAINGRFLFRSITGVERFAGELVKTLDMLLDRSNIDCNVAIIVPRIAGFQYPHYRKVSYRFIGNSAGHLWEQFQLPKAVSSDELLINLCNTAPLFKSRQLATIHDAAVVRVPETFSQRFRVAYRSLMPLVGRRAQHVMTVSEFSKDEISNCFGIPKAKISVLLQGCDHMGKVEEDSSVLARFGLSPGTFVLGLGSAARHKNQQSLVQAAQVLRKNGIKVKVVLAGGRNGKIFSSEDSDTTDVIRLGYVTDEELKALYLSAICFVFPSLYEGFGIPPIEAMSCGCPVIASNAASIPEICGDAALFFHPENVEEIATLVQNVVLDDALRRTLAERGKSRAAQFTWSAAGNNFLRLIGNLKLKGRD